MSIGFLNWGLFFVAGDATIPSEKGTATMFVHSVFFWLRKDLTEEQRRAFQDGLEGLKPIEAVQALYVGTPAATDRPIIDRSYSVALTVLFRDKAGCAAYEVHPLHKDFVRDFSSFWERIIVYDAE